MTPCRGARLCFAAAAMSVLSAARAGVWATEPVLGLSADYSTNPGLLAVEHSAETHGALLLDAPTTYNADAAKVSIQPSFRFSDSPGYSSLASDYEHLTVVGEIDSERNTLTATGEVARDSSLYYNYYFNGSTGVRRDSTIADVAWARALSERLKFNLDVNATRVLYGESSGYNTLSDYVYATASPNLSWQVGEATTLSLQGAAGRYKSIDGTTGSLNSSIELGLTRKFNELWSLSANAGVSHETDRIHVYYGPFLLGTLESASNGTVYSVNLKRQGQLTQISLQGSRSLIPSGYAYLSRQESYQANVYEPLSARWTLGGHVRWLQSQNPQSFGTTIDQNYTDIGLTAVWLWTEHWSVTMLASHVTNKLHPPVMEATASGFSVQLSRRFNRIEWH
jgi:hypothetical protein